MPIKVVFWCTETIF